MICQIPVINGFLHQDPGNTQLMGVVKLPKLTQTSFVQASGLMVLTIPETELVIAKGSPFQPSYPSAQTENVGEDIPVRIQIRLKPGAKEYDFVRVQLWLSAPGDDGQLVDLNLMVLRSKWDPNIGTYLEVF
jgi:hypothetical protein